MPQLQRDHRAAVTHGCAFVFAIPFLGFTLFWEALAWVLPGPPEARLTMQLFGLPFVLFGVWMLVRPLWSGLIRTLAVNMNFAEPTVALSSEPLRVGERFTLCYEQVVKRDVDVSRVLVQLILREWVTYRSGRKNAIATHEVVVLEFDGQPWRYHRGNVIREERELRIPIDAMHTFMGHNNRLEWFVRTRLSTPSWPDAQADFNFRVLPELAR